MDGARVDSRSRSVPVVESRRRALTAVLGGSLAALSLRDTTAKKKHRHRGKDTTCDTPAVQVACPTCETCPEPPTAPTCAQVCGSCNFCFTRAAVSQVCNARTNFYYDCDTSPVCSSDNDCVNTVSLRGYATPYCVTHLSAYNRTTSSYESASTVCPTPGGRCAELHEPCSA